jgi:hypothetical protein
VVGKLRSKYKKNERPTRFSRLIFGLRGNLADQTKRCFITDYLARTTKRQKKTPKISLKCSFFLLHAYQRKYLDRALRPLARAKRNKNREILEGHSEMKCRFPNCCSKTEPQHVLRGALNSTASETRNFSFLKTSLLPMLMLPLCLR